jgi:hypothetical protein
MAKIGWMAVILCWPDGTTTTVYVPPARAYSPFVTYAGQVWQCRNVASTAGEYDQLGRYVAVES